MEVAILRMILKSARLWMNLAADVKMLPAPGQRAGTDTRRGNALAGGL
jgi:hypothetical protein